MSINCLELWLYVDKWVQCYSIQIYTFSLRWELHFLKSFEFTVDRFKALGVLVVFNVFYFNDMKLDWTIVYELNIINVLSRSGIDILSLKVL